MENISSPYYKITDISCFISTDNRTPLLFRDSCDWERFGQGDLRAYFNDAYKIFAGELEKFQDIERPLTEKEEHRLYFMMDALMHAKKVWHEECGTPASDSSQNTTSGAQ
jgi:hypothetical protein